MDQGCTSAVQHLPGKHKVQKWIPSTKRKREKKEIYIPS